MPSLGFKALCIVISFSFLWFPFLRSSVVFLLSTSDFFPSVISLFPFFIISMAHFSIQNSIPVFLLKILIVSIRDSDYTSSLAKILISHEEVSLFL